MHRAHQRTDGTEAVEQACGRGVAASASDFVGGADGRLTLYHNIPRFSPDHSRMPSCPVSPRLRPRRRPGACPVLPCRRWRIGSSGDHARRHDQHDAVDLNAVEVHATPLAGTAEDLARPVEVLAGEKLDEAKANSLGETVGKLPGVQSSYFGPGVGRPIVRGFDGARVQVLERRPGLGRRLDGERRPRGLHRALPRRPDRGAQGPGHPALRQRRDRRRGQRGRRPRPRALTDAAAARPRRTARRQVNDERTGHGALDGRHRTASSLHVDALHRETGDYAIPGYAESAARLAERRRNARSGQPRRTAPTASCAPTARALGVSWIGDARLRRRRREPVRHPLRRARPRA